MTNFTSFINPYSDVFFVDKKNGRIDQFSNVRNIESRYSMDFNEPEYKIIIEGFGQVRRHYLPVSIDNISEEDIVSVIEELLNGNKQNDQRS